ncbi:SusC/RagA family TonB-linked outer membrane protein [Sphingobacterium oryzagri]|uniref:SusC/RagA family TonB-linked outer membrane protein n=1 Tax=Sphingobacterium oryzagri TaxID=3025669 RepID=A0ABY7WCE5_9SPHI|nr:SusC/RagA family TonB-linked outer membrane protein [Sphingobacterium sp. KACC 22765]WDF67324.1 SusC/RagA family TonB-linked outer membrane protein [Sphingobacterium sp. KACC 22765]
MKKHKPEKLRLVRASRYKLLAVLLICCTLAMAHSQENNRISIQGRAISVTKALDQIKQQSKITVMYQDEIIDKQLTLDLSLKDVTLTDALSRICASAGLEYTLRDKYVLITKAKGTPRSTTTASPVAQQKSQIAQTRYARGRVVNDAGEPLPGASVVVEGADFSLSTDSRGSFTVPVPTDRNAVLIITFVGMAPKRVSVKPGATNEQLGDISLQLKQNEFEEIVITGYQQIKRRNLTASVSSVNMDDIQMPGVTDVNRMLEGRIPDMMVMNNSSEVNSTPRLRIRGTSTVIGSREPLWVVDGVIQTDPINISPEQLNDPDFVNRMGNAIAGVNPQDIQRLDVLKDAAATALYGARAANGVIVVTTKRGRVSKPVVTYNTQLTMRRRPRYADRRLNLMNSQERVQFSQLLVDKQFLYPLDMPLVGYEAALAELYAGRYTEAQFQEEVANLSTRNTDWFDILTHDSFSQDHAVNVSGGNKTTRYYVSAGYTDDNDVVKDVYNRRYTIASNFDISLSDKLEVQFNFRGNLNNRRFTQDDINPVNYAYNTSRLVPSFSADGSRSFYRRPVPALGYMPFNILHELDNSFQEVEGNGATMMANIKYQVNDWLNISALGSGGIMNALEAGYWGDQTFYAATIRRSEYGVAPPVGSLMPYGGEWTQTDSNTKNYTARLQANVDKTFGSRGQHNVNALLGTEANTSIFESYRDIQRGYYAERGRQFVSDIPSSFTQYANWVLSNRPTIVDRQRNLLSVYSTAAYGYANYFSVNFNARFDGSNQFGNRSNERLLPVWAISGLVNLKNIADPQNKISFLDDLSIRGSYGQQGNMQDNQSPVLTLRRGSYSAYYNEPVSTVGLFANPDLRWEKTHSSNAGLDAVFLKGRLTLSTEYYYKRTVDAFMNKPISDVNGFTSYVVNSGVITNRGFNVTLTTIPVRTEDFRWTFSALYSRVMNSMETAPGQSTYQLNNFLNGTAVVAGQPVETFYSYRFKGLSPIDGGPLFDDWEDRQSELVGLGQYDTYTRVLEPSGVRIPTTTGSINNTFSYKSLRLNVNLFYNLGAKTRLFRLLGDVQDGYSAGRNFNRDLLDAWQRPGDEQFTTIPALMSSSTAGHGYYVNHFSEGTTYGGVNFANNAWEMYDYSSARVVSANMLRINSVALTYEFPKELLAPYKLSRLAMTLGATNLYTWGDKRLRGQMPSQNGFSEVQLTDTPTFTFGLNVSL